MPLNFPPTTARNPWYTALLLLTLAFFSGAGRADDDEALLKAGFISKFPSYVTWPHPPAATGPRPFVYCVLGETPVTAQLRSLLALSPGDDRHARVRQLSHPSDADGCQLLLVAADHANRINSVLQEIGNHPVLVVGETAGLAQRGAHISLYRAGDRLRFAVNRSAFKRSGLGVSFRLLEMAKVVE